MTSVKCKNMPEILEGSTFFGGNKQINKSEHNRIPAVLTESSNLHLGCCITGLANNAHSDPLCPCPAPITSFTNCVKEQVSFFFQLLKAKSNSDTSAMLANISAQPNHHLMSTVHLRSSCSKQVQIKKLDKQLNSKEKKVTTVTKTLKKKKTTTQQTSVEQVIQI